MRRSPLPAQLTTLTESLKQTNTLITRLSTLTFQPGSESLSEDGDSVHLELAQDIHESLAQLEENLELLKQDVEDIGESTSAPSGLAGRTRSGSLRRGNRGTEVERLGAGVLKLSEDLKSARVSFRRAQISAKRSAEAAKVREREVVFATLLQPPPQPSTPTHTTGDLFAGRSKGKSKQQQRSGDDLLVTTSSDLTTSLRRTHALLSTELSRSRFAAETFSQSTAALEELGEKYSDLTTVLTKSRDLLGTLVRSQKSDTWYLETAFYLLLATISWLVFRRILYGPFVRLPLFFYRALVFIANWLLLKPLILFCSVTGIITSTPYNPSSTSVPQATKSRRPLIVHRSASGPATPLPKHMAEKLKQMGVPVGSGGEGAKRDKNGELAGEASERIGKMAAAGEEAVRRGDGTVLQERGDEPVNPRKKLFVEDPEEARKEERQARGRDEL